MKMEALKDWGVFRSKTNKLLMDLVLRKLVGWDASLRDGYSKIKYFREWAILNNKKNCNYESPLCEAEESFRNSEIIYIYRYIYNTHIYMDIYEMSFELKSTGWFGEKLWLTTSNIEQWLFMRSLMSLYKDPGYSKSVTDEKYIHGEAMTWN